MSRTLVVAAASALGACALWRLLRRRRACHVDGLTDLSSFQLDEVLVEGELTVLLGAFAWQQPGEQALIKLSLRPAPLGDGVLLRSLDTAVTSYSGAEYCYYHGVASLLSMLRSTQLRPSYNMEVIAPASAKQIARSRPQKGVMITETPAVYADHVAPFLAALNPKAVAWVYNVLDLSKEKERMLYNDTDARSGFLLNVDTKWKSHPDCHASDRASWRGHDAVKDLYCLAICHRRDVRSLRDLSAEHLPLLRNILSAGTAAIERIYGVPANELRVFVHYQPQFYHFHVHFTRLHNDLGCQVERAHLLPEIISTLEAEPLAYTQRKTLYYQLKANDALLGVLQKAGCV